MWEISMVCPEARVCLLWGWGWAGKQRFLSGLILVPKSCNDTHARQEGWGSKVSVFNRKHEGCGRWAEEVSGELGLGWLRTYGHKAISGCGKAQRASRAGGNGAGRRRKLVGVRRTNID